jgi:uroporphyrin-III C-methyltransferase
MEKYTSEVQQKFRGKVTLVGFGPGDPDLLTLGGERAISNADIIFFDDLIDSTFLDRYTAEKVYVGKRCHRHSHEQDEINQLMVDAAYAQKNVVRLKGGDPMIFGHGGEEIEFLHNNGIEVKVIPGISTGTAVAALTQIPLTHRGISSSVSFITGHRPDLSLPNTDTLVCYMAGGTIHKIAAQAIAEGRKPETPVMLVHNVSHADQKEYFSTLEALSVGDETYPTPIIIVIGDVVNLRNKEEESEEDIFDIIEKEFSGNLGGTHLNWGI